MVWRQVQNALRQKQGSARAPGRAVPPATCHARTAESARRGAGPNPDSMLRLHTSGIIVDVRNQIQVTMWSRTVGPLIIESPQAKKRVSTGVL